MMKRTMSPKFWPIERKTRKFAVTPMPGPHRKERCIPLGIILRDMLHYATTERESMVMLNKGEVRIDSHVRKDVHFPVGLMDVLEIGEENYRVLPSENGFRLQKIDEGESNIKPEKIVSKTSVKKGRTQLNLFDGRNILAGKDSYETGDTVVIDTRKNAITQVIKMQKGSLVIVTGGKNSGKTGTIDSITTVKTHAAQVTVDVEGGKIIVPKNYIFAIGDKESAIKVGE